MTRRRTAILAIILPIVLLGATCDPVEPPKPILSITDEIESEITHWLDFRVETMAQWRTIQDGDWKEANTLDVFGDWFRNNMGDPDYWDMAQLIADIQNTELYLNSGWTNDELLAKLKDEFEKYRPDPDLVIIEGEE